jgi:hypothetical protein
MQAVDPHLSEYIHLVPADPAGIDFYLNIPAGFLFHRAGKFMQGIGPCAAFGHDHGDFNLSGFSPDTRRNNQNEQERQVDRFEE